MVGTERRSGKAGFWESLKLVPCGAFSACVAEAATIPFDTAKVNLQISNRNVAGQVHYKGFVDFFVRSARENGVASLWNGLRAGLLRQIFYAGIRLGTYEQMRDFLALRMRRKEGSGIFEKILAAVSTGAVAIIIASPADLLKGLPPNIARNATINTAELVTYDIFKTFFIQRKIFLDNIYCHVSSALSAGFVATVVGSPLDVIKTRTMNSSGQRRGMLRTAVHIVRSEGGLALYKGFASNYIRIGSWNLVMFLVFERMKRVFIYGPEKSKGV